MRMQAHRLSFCERFAKAYERSARLGMCGTLTGSSTTRDSIVPHHLLEPIDLL